MRHRFHALCPYFAMFPETFAEYWIERLTKPGDVIIDPFCGRGTLPFQALLMQRQSIGCDTNPVAYCVSHAKTNAPSPKLVMSRITDLEEAYDQGVVHNEVGRLPVFFHRAYHPVTLHQIVYLRNELQYKRSLTDCMLSALTLGSLHGEADRSDRFLSNQMPHTISTKPDYSVRFWKRHQRKAPMRDVFELLRRQVAFRYENERPKRRGLILHADMRDLPRHVSRFPRPIRCVVTSPPYFDVTNYAEDQWLRLWFLGGPAHPTKTKFSRDDRHGTVDQYWLMLADMWRALSLVLDRKSHIVIRLGATRIGPERLVSGLEGVARVTDRRVRLVDYTISNLVKRQTDAFRPGSTGCKLEVDCHFEMT
jgi:DNA methylase